MATLNLHNPEGLYTGGNVNFNPAPYVKMAMDARARKEAREQAIDQYYQKLPDTINDKGLRDQEVPIINDYKNKIFEFGLKNKEALRNPKIDNGAAQLELQKLMRGAQSVARESQNAAKTDLELGKLWFNKDNQWALSNDDFIKQHDLHNLPVTDPNYKKMDLANVMAQKPFDKNALIKRNADIKYSDGVPQISNHPTDPLSQIVTTKPELDEQNKQVLFARAADDLHTDPKFAKMIKNDLANSPELPNLVNIATDVFKIPKDKLTDEAIAAAYEYSLLPVKQTVQKIQPNKIAEFDYKRKANMEDFRVKQKIMQADRKELIGMREDVKAAGEEANNLWIDNYLDKIAKESKNEANRINYKFSNGKQVSGYKIQLDPVLSKAVGIDANNPGQLVLSDNGDYILGFYSKDENDNIIVKDGKYVIDPTRRTVLTKDALKLALGGKAGTKQMNKEMAVPSKKTSSKKGELDDL